VPNFIIMKKPYGVLFLVTFFCSCSHQPGSKSTDSTAKKSRLITAAQRGSPPTQRDSIFQKEAIIINGVKYTALCSGGSGYNGITFYIKNSNNKTVFTTTNLLNFELKDVDGDGNTDVLLERRGVDSGQQDLVLYDPKTDKFILVGNCSNANKIKNTKYYYSYEDCCMGRYWSSDLFYIYNFKIVRAGYIKYDDGDGLRFYSINDEREALLKKWHVRINGDTPITTGRYIDFDLGDYWTRNYSGFVK
jgi:hypothetical protein